MTLHHALRRPRCSLWPLCAALLLNAFIAASPAAERDPIATDIHETVVSVPMTEHGLFGDHTRNLVATTYMPDGPGPFPLIVLSHGNPQNAYDRVKVGRYRKLAQIREFVHLGFAVIVPIRRGYGDTGGSFEEGTGISCTNPDFEKAGHEAAQDLLATIAFADTLPQIDRDHVILVGQSAGGFASVAAASYAPKGLVAVVNFSGGRGGRPAQHPGDPCGPERMRDTYAHFATTIRVPILWHYVENDMYFGSAPKSWFRAFQQAGGRGELVYEAPFGRDGHGMFAADRAIPIWLPHFKRFVSSVVTLKPDAGATADASSVARQ